MLPGPGFRWDRAQLPRRSLRTGPDLAFVEIAIGEGKRGEGSGLGLVSGGLVFFDRRQRNLRCTCSRVPPEDSDGERAHHKENQASRG